MLSLIKIAVMKYLFMVVALLALNNSACRKKSNDAAGDCAALTITQQSAPSSLWGIKLGDNFYPSNNIPDEFKREGATVYGCYLLYSDLRACACCGGTWADIKSMRTFIR
jgi:hypothetical protein